MITALLTMALLTQETYNVETDRFIVGDIHQYQQLVELEDQFNRKLGGCPPRGHAGECIPGAGVLDLKLWNEICRRAQKVFIYQKDVSPKTRR